MSDAPNVNLVKPPKAIGEMTDAELDAFADMLFGALATDVEGRGGKAEDPTS